MPGRECGVKRLSAEGVSEQSEEGRVLKKTKVASPPTTPKEKDEVVLCGGEALPVDTDLGPKTFFDSQNSPSKDLGPKTFFESPDLGPKTFFDSQVSPCKDFGTKTYFESPVSPSGPKPLRDSPKSPDLFSEQRSVLRDLEQSPRCSPATPKSPIILTARSRRHLAENQENKSPSLIVSYAVCEASSVPSPGKSLHVARPLQFASSPTRKPSPVKPVKPNVTSTTLSSHCKPSPKKPVKSNALIKPLNFVTSPKNVNITEHNRSVDQDQSLTFQNSRKTKSAKSKTVSTYLNGQSKLEFQPADKSVKSTKLKQSKLSLSMFQPKKSTVTTSTHLSDEDQQFLLALEESIKIQNVPQSSVRSSSFEKNMAVDPNQTFYQGPLHSSTAAHSKVIGDQSISPIKNSIVKDKAVTSTTVAAVEPEAGPSRPPPAPLTPLEKEYLTNYDR